MNYNLLQERWIPVLRINGEVDCVSIIEVLTQAGDIRFITLASPLDLFAVHRFILTLLYWKAGLAGGVERVQESLLKDGIIPSAVIDDIKNEEYYFDLFNDKSPFLQDPSARDEKKKGRDKKSVGSLFVELASGTNIAHFQHGDDENMRLCLPCTTLGMLRVVPWSQSGGRGLTPSVHNAPPIMAIATGDKLAVTLGLNLVPLDVKAGEAKWSGHFTPTDPARPIPYLEALTWNPRRIFLPLPQVGTCWYCGQSEVLTVGKIDYLKNEKTKSNKKNRNTIPFIWQDPSAFYFRDEPYRPAKSNKDNQAIDNNDLAVLLEKLTIKKQQNPPESIVVTKNQDHQWWHLIIPCTDRAKAFDYRRLELTNLSPETIRALLPLARPSRRQSLNGWKEPERARPPKGIRLFMHTAVRLLTYTDWAALSNAAYQEMHDSPSAFDVLSGLYWGLRDKRIKGLPSRNVAWLMLKLMAAVPAHVRVMHSDAKFCPLQLLPKRQRNERGRAFLYPISFPHGSRLEAALRGALDGNIRRRHPESVDWIGLCHGLDQLLD